MEKYYGAENYPVHSPFFAPTKLVLLVTISISATEAEESGFCEKSKFKHEKWEHKILQQFFQSSSFIFVSLLGREKSCHFRLTRPKFLPEAASHTVALSFTSKQGRLMLMGIKRCPNPTVIIWELGCLTPVGSFEKSCLKLCSLVQQMRSTGPESQQLK